MICLKASIRCKISEAYSEHCQIYKMDRFAKTINYFLLLSIFPIRSIIDVWQASEYTFEYAKNSPTFFLKYFGYPVSLLNPFCAWCSYQKNFWKFLRSNVLDKNEFRDLEEQLWNHCIMKNGCGLWYPHMGD